MTSGMIAALSSNLTRVISSHNLNKIGFVLIQACMYEPRSYQFNMAETKAVAISRRTGNIRYVLR
ncbi:hypothetical protein B7P43_G15389 [Cryptotermes secundus]|uniref:Uncharacterized protein n=1 Tax=Cryptotermes secundus TaxID=105785 RepID=A0A2J7RGQ0_9NEOP|nr:hypothetical protein B7P43_G15389 [Cryptotermes secundus]